jgi:hypothetical protein
LPRPHGNTNPEDVAAQRRFNRNVAKALTEVLSLRIAFGEQIGADIRASIQVVNQPGVEQAGIHLVFVYFSEDGAEPSNNHAPNLATGTMFGSNLFITNQLGLVEFDIEASVVPSEGQIMAFYLAPLVSKSTSWS